MLFFGLFSHDARLLPLAAGEALFRRGDAGDCMYVLVRGEAEIQVGSLPVEQIGPGAIVGEMGVIDGSPRSATVVACTECEFSVIDKRRFLFLVQETPRFAIEVMKVMAMRLRQCDDKLLGTTESPGAV